jgi:hypothetical protein
MENEQILELTASERLSLEEEYEMQKSWYEDDNSEYTQNSNSHMQS